MAKILIAVDTDDKTLDVTIEGQRIDNARYVSIYSEQDAEYAYNAFSVCVEAGKPHKKGSVNKTETYTSYGSVEAKEMIVAHKEKGEINQDIVKFLKRE